MNYQVQYTELIEEYQALNIIRTDNPDLTLEDHHIMPRALGGGNEAENMVMLPARIHYNAHYLLAKIHGGKMANAFWLMSHKNTNSAKGVKVSAEEYEEARRLHVGAITGRGNSMFGKYHRQDTKVKISESHKGRVISKEHKAKISRSCTGIKRTPETKARMRTAQTGKKLTKETRAKMSKAKKGENHPSYDNTTYIFKHKDGDTFTGTRYDFRIRYNLNHGNLGNVIRGTQKTIKGWVLVG